MNGGLIGHPVDPINFILTTNRDLLSAGGACTNAVHLIALTLRVCGDKGRHFCAFLG
jgi:hypothetical protein